MKKLLFIAFLSTFFIFFPNKNIYAQTGTRPADDKDLFCEDKRSINTALGCIDVSSFGGLAEFFLRWSFGVAGGISLLLIFYGGFSVMIAGPDPKKAQAGKETITAAIGGLIFLLFSIFLLRLIGVQIFQIPGF